MFFFKPKKVIVDCFTKDSVVHEYASIEPATKHFPKWWQALPNKYTEFNRDTISIPYSTMKGCYGFTELYKSAHVMPMWSDLSIKVYPIGGYAYQYSANIPLSAETHSAEQYGSEFDSFQHIKLESPWQFRETSGVKFYFGDMFWNRVKTANNYVIPPGVVDYNVHGTTNVNLFVNKGDTEFIIPHRQPLVLIIPLTQREVEFRNHLVSVEEYATIVQKTTQTSFIGSFMSHKRLQKSKCPFSS